MSDFVDVLARQLLDAANDAILLVDQDTWRILWANRTAERLYKRDAATLCAMTVADLRPPLARGQTAAHISSVVSHQGAVFESTHMDADGEIIPVEVSSRPVEAAGRRMLFSIARDLRERDRLRRELHEFVERLNAIVHTAPEAILALSTEGLVTVWNEGAERMLGWTAAEVIGRPVPFVPEHRRAEYERLFARILGGERLQNVELRRVRKDGREIDVSLSSAAVRNAQGEVIGVMALVHDISARKAAERRQAHLLDEIRALNQELEARVERRTAELRRVNDELTQINAELEAFTYSVSHDLRAPLRAIDGFSRILEEDHGGALDTEARRVLGVIRANSTRMAALMESLLALSRAGRAELHVGPVDMRRLLDEVLAEMLPPAARARVRLEIGDLPPAIGDVHLLRQVLTNLVGNAVKFSAPRPAPHIAIGGVARGHEVEYFVRDNGVGFDPRYAHRLFGAFQRLHRAEDFEGTGVGLALVQRIALRHGGRAWATGQLGKGATFWVALPASTAPAP